MPFPPSVRARAPWRLLPVAILAVAVLVGCATPSEAPSLSQRLRGLLAAGDLASADALIATHPRELDARRALDLAIRGGHVAAVRHFLAATGPDAPLDPDGSTPLIRAVVDAPGPVRAELVALLVAAGADPTRVDRYGRGPIDYAATRNRGELIALMDPPAPLAAPRRGAAFVTWLGADAPLSAVTRDAVPAGTRGAARAEGVVRPDAGARRTTEPSPRRATDADPRRVRDPQAATTSLLLARSPWRPAGAADPGAERAALRFHADGAMDVLRWVSGQGERGSLPDAYGAWQVDADGRLRLAIVAPAFDVGCLSSSVSASSASADSPARATPLRSDRADREAASADRLVLACEDLPPPSAGASRSLDRARTLLDRIGEAHAPSIVAIAAGRAPMPGEARADDASHDAAAPTRLAVALAGSPPLAACRPARARPRTPVASSRVLGDWHALDVHRFESRAPTSGALCPQTVARDAALAACRTDSGRDAAACRSVGGCPAGQVSVVAGLPGVEAGWIGCAADPVAARRRALDACRADLGCDCQVAAFSGRNLLNGAGGSVCTAPRR